KDKEPTILVSKEKLGKFVEQFDKALTANNQNLSSHESITTFKAVHQYPDLSVLMPTCQSRSSSYPDAICYTLPSFLLFNYEFDEDVQKRFTTLSDAFFNKQVQLDDIIVEMSCLMLGGEADLETMPLAANGIVRSNTDERMTNLMKQVAQPMSILLLNKYNPWLNQQVEAWRSQTLKLSRLANQTTIQSFVDGKTYLQPAAPQRYETWLASNEGSSNLLADCFNPQAKSLLPADISYKLNHHAGTSNIETEVSISSSVEDVTKQPVSLYLLLDFTTSMRKKAEDSQTTRWHYACDAALAFLKTLPADFKVSVSRFGTGLLEDPLLITRDEAIEKVTTIKTHRPNSHTDFGATLNALSQRTNKARQQIIMITDGETRKRYHPSDHQIVYPIFITHRYDVSPPASLKALVHHDNPNQVIPIFKDQDPAFLDFMKNISEQVTNLVTKKYGIVPVSVYGYHHENGWQSVHQAQVQLGLEPTKIKLRGMDYDQYLIVYQGSDAIQCAAVGFDMRQLRSELDCIDLLEQQVYAPAVLHQDFGGLFPAYPPVRFHQGYGDLYWDYQGDQGIDQEPEYRSLQAVSTDSAALYRSMSTPIAGRHSMFSASANQYEVTLTELGDSVFSLSEEPTPKRRQMFSASSTAASASQATQFIDMGSSYKHS
ncbi:MAG: VWA domain-containing protein, partial [Pseudomonadota bacterium]|nr:VWA domain-containing protein [Pseudomonadota bacterium]